MDKDFADMLADILSSATTDESPLGRVTSHNSSILPEAQIAELRAFASHYTACLNAETFPFAVGDLVTPDPRAGIRGAGAPYVVLEIAPDAAPLWEPATDAIGSARQGSRLNLRVLAMVDTDWHGEAVVAHWGEAWQFVPYGVPTD